MSGTARCSWPKPSLPYDEPDQLRAGIHDNLTTLGVERLTAVNLRVMDNAAPDARFVDQLGALMTARDEGLIGGIGISNVSRGHLMRALLRPPSRGRWPSHRTYY